MACSIYGETAFKAVWQDVQLQAQQQQAQQQQAQQQQAQQQQAQQQQAQQQQAQQQWREKQATESIQSADNVDMHLDGSVRSQFRRDPSAALRQLNYIDVVDEETEMHQLLAIQRSETPSNSSSSSSNSSASTSLSLSSSSTRLPRTIVDKAVCAARLVKVASEEGLLVASNAIDPTTLPGQPPSSSFLANPNVDSDAAQFLSEAVQIYLQQVVNGAYHNARHRLNRPAEQFGDLGQKGVWPYRAVHAEIDAADVTFAKRDAEDEAAILTNLKERQEDYARLHRKYKRNTANFSAPKKVLAEECAATSRGEVDVKAVARLCKSLRLARNEAIGPFTEFTANGNIAKRARETQPTSSESNGVDPSSSSGAGAAEASSSAPEGAPLEIPREAIGLLAHRRQSSSTGRMGLSVSARDVEQYKTSIGHY